MARKSHLTAHEQRALRLAAWGHTAAGHGYADGMAVLPPQPPAEREAARQYHAGYVMGCEQRREPWSANRGEQ